MITREIIDKAVKEFLENGGKIQYLDSEKNISSNPIGFGYSSNGVNNKYGYDSTVYASPKQTDKGN